MVKREYVAAGIIFIVIGIVLPLYNFGTAANILAQSGSLTWDKQDALATLDKLRVLSIIGIFCAALGGILVGWGARSGLQIK